MRNLITFLSSAALVAGLFTAPAFAGTGANPASYIHRGHGHVKAEGQVLAGVNGASYGHGRGHVKATSQTLAGVNGAAYGHGHGHVKAEGQTLAGVNGAAYGHGRHV